MSKKIDVIISYVNPNDENWVGLYNRYKNESEEEYKEKRFRDTSFLKYVLRSINKNLKWVNNVFLAVQSDSQVPEWINRDNVNVVLHEDFIPKEFLPTFNCNTIELFMHKIPNLSEYFIYFNDDMIINKSCSIDDFFKNWKCNLSSLKKNSNVGKNTWYNCLYNDTRVINKFLGKNEDEKIWHYFPHTVTPLYKPLCEKAYESFEKEIKSRTTRFRDYINFNQHFYAYYIENSDMCANIPITVNYVNINNYKNTFLQNANALTICINDSVRYSNEEIFEYYNIIIKDLEEKFPDLSKYEKGFKIKERNKSDIDAILVYVNPNDEQWRALYNEYITKESGKDEKSLSDERIREMFSLKGIIRSIEKNMPFISNFHLVVQSDSQVPEWINRDNVNVVLHEDFIPKEFLPTFNSHTIEMFLHKIPELANRYIVFNDDMLIMKKHAIDDIFDGMIPKDMFYLNKTEDISYHYSLIERYYDTHPNLRLHPHINNNMLAFDYVGKEYDGNFYYRPNHGFVAFNKEFVEDVYNKYENDIKRSCTKFRDDKNLYYYAYRLCNFLKYKKVSMSTSDFITFKKSPAQIHEKLINNDFGCLALNDDGLNEKYKNEYTNVINNFIFKNFSKISKYENEEKIAVCLICKNESGYDLNKWIYYYKSIGFDNVIFYDNNDKNNKNQYKHIKEWIDCGFVIYNNAMGIKNRPKLLTYKHCYETYSNNFDFIAFFDIDEYLILKNNICVKDYLSNDIFRKCDIIQLGRKSIIYEDNKILSSYTNSLVKSIIKTKNKNIIFNKTFVKTYEYATYSPTPSKKEIVVVDSCGNIVTNTPYCKTLNMAYIKHYYSISFNNFLLKLKKGNPKENLFNQVCLSYVESELKKYFSYVKPTQKHYELINRIFPEYGITEKTIFNIENDNVINEKIDYVFPYVDDTDENWLKEYNKYKKNIDYENNNLEGKARYRTYDLLKYKLRSIEKYMPWINNIYMIVASPSQVPKWLDTSKVKIVYHKDIIPEEFLPTFNSGTIEMFLGNIEGLSEKFIYGNDDFYVNRMVSPKMFFRGDKSLLYFYERSNKVRDEVDKYGIAFQSNNINLLIKESIIKLDYIYNPGHGDKPIHKSTCNTILKKYKDIIYDSVSRFRDYKNFNQYLFQLYDVTHNKSIAYKQPFHSCFRVNNSTIQKLSNVLLNNDNNFYCVSIDFNGGLIDEFVIEYINSIFNKKFPKKSKYEK